LIFDPAVTGGGLLRGIGCIFGWLGFIFLSRFRNLGYWVGGLVLKDDP